MTFNLRVIMKRKIIMNNKNYCKSLNKGICSKSNVSHDWRQQVLILATIPFKSPTFMQFCLALMISKSNFLLPEFLACWLMTVFVLKKSLCCLFYINAFSDIPLDFTIIHYTSLLKFYSVSRGNFEINNT